MALFKNTTEIKNYISVNVSTNIDSVMPYIKQAEQMFIIPLLSQGEYDALNTAYNSLNPLTSDQQALLEKIQMPLINLAYLLYSPVLAVHISDSGIHTTKTENKTTAFQYQTDELAKSFLNIGNTGLDMMLEFLESKKNIFTSWAASSAYTVYKECFINTAKDFSVLGLVEIGNSRLRFLAMKAIMKRVEAFRIKSIICTDLFAELKTQIEAGTVTAANQFLLDLIRPAVANLTFAAAIPKLSVLITEKGISVFNNDRAQTINVLQPASDTMLSKLISDHTQDGEAYLKELKTFLDDNVNTYPKYKLSKCYEKDSTSTFTNKSDNGIHFMG